MCSIFSERMAPEPSVKTRINLISRDLNPSRNSVWFDSLHPSQQFFSYIRTGLPVLNQYQTRINVSCSRTQCSDAGEAQTSNPSVLSQAPYHWATSLFQKQCQYTINWLHLTRPEHCWLGNITSNLAYYKVHHPMLQSNVGDCVFRSYYKQHLSLYPFLQLYFI